MYGAGDFEGCGAEGGVFDVNNRFTADAVAMNDVVRRAGFAVSGGIRLFTISILMDEREDASLTRVHLPFAELARTSVDRRLRMSLLAKPVAPT